MPYHALSTIARLEWTIHLRGRWIVMFTVVFATLCLAISYFGTVTAGAAGIQGFERTTASLLNLVLYMVPLFGLTLGTLNISRERSVNEVLFSQPVPREQILFGRLLGLLGSLAVPILLGFSVAGSVVMSEVGPDGASRFVLLAGISLLLAAVFLALGACVGLMTESRTKAFGVSLAVWFFFVLFYDLAAMGAAFLLRERTANVVIFLSLFGNPVDLARVSSLLTISDPSIFGPAGAALLKFLGGPALSQVALAAALFAWLAVPAAICRAMIRRIDL